MTKVVVTLLSCFVVLLFWLVLQLAESMDTLDNTFAYCADHGGIANLQLKRSLSDLTYYNVTCINGTTWRVNGPKQ